MKKNTTLEEKVKKEIEGLNVRDAIQKLDELLMTLKRDDGKDNIMRKAILKVLKDFGKEKGMDLKYQYLINGSSFKSFSKRQDLIDLMEMHTVFPKIARNHKSAIKINYINKKIDSVFDMKKCVHKGAEGYTKRVPLVDDLDFNASQCLPKNLYKIVYTSKGNNRIGGEYPNEFQMPSNIGKIPLEYICHLSTDDKGFAWLPFDIHVVCPILLDDFEVVFMDYSNPLKPQLMNRSELEKCTYQEEIPSDFRRVFKPKAFKLSKTYLSYDRDLNLRAGGVPAWIQRPQIIKSPKNGKTMKFVFQLFTNDRIKTTKKSGLPSCDTLNFWSDGCFYLFFEPESKVVAMFIQNT